MNKFEFGEEYIKLILKGERKGDGSDVGIIAEVISKYLKEKSFIDIDNKIAILVDYRKKLKEKNMLTDFAEGAISVLETILIEVKEKNLKNSNLQFLGE